MKNTKVTLYKFDKDSDVFEFLDIDWPKVQRTIGKDQIQWLWELPREQGQLCLEIDTKGNKSLVAEFYDSRIAQKYAMMWS